MTNFFCLDIYYASFNFKKDLYQQNSKEVIFKWFNILNDLRKYYLKKYIYTINHKRIGLNYFYFSFWTGCSGAALATAIRLELAHCGSPFFKGDSLKYLQVITAHGLTMVFFVVVPIIFGGFANFLIPYHIGSKDVAFPRLNNIGFWIQPAGYLLVARLAYLRKSYWKYHDPVHLILPLLDKSKHRKLNYFRNNGLLVSAWKHFGEERFFLTWKARKDIQYTNFDYYCWTPLKMCLQNIMINCPESFYFFIKNTSNKRRKKVFFSKCTDRTLTTAGWTFITPFSSNRKYTGMGAQDVAITAVIVAGISTTITFTNLLITKRTLAMPGLRNRRILLPFVTISILLTLRLLVLITPVLAAVMVMMALDRHWKTCFFEFAYGGDPILSQHLFWFFGHPEVYVLIIPGFGLVSVIIPYVNTRRVASKHHMIWAVYIMSYLGFLVWGHHMYVVGLDHRSRTMYSTITIMISLPATIKFSNWSLSLITGGLRVDASLVCTVSFLLFFLVAGFTGMWLSHVGLNISMHDTFYVVAHFHLMLAGATVTSSFAGFYFYFSTFFGIRYSRVFAYLHIIYYSGGQWMTFLPQFYLGFSGMPRRICDYPAAFTGWNSMSTAGHFVGLIGVVFFFLMLLDSHIERRVATPSNLGIPRWYKRISYYIFKIRYLSMINKRLSRLPNYSVRKKLDYNRFVEYEYYI